MIHRRQDGMERWPETAPVSRCWVQSQNLGKSGDAWSRNGVPSPQGQQTSGPDIQTRCHGLGHFPWRFFSLSLSLPGYLFFQLGNSIINRHGAKPGVNASAPRTLAPVARGPPAPAPYCMKVIRTTHWSCRTSL
ncbi:hypothetical protein HDV62DRAFT_98951 [Trichoderma sp. SZMC 28011]